LISSDKFGKDASKKVKEKRDIVTVRGESLKGQLRVLHAEISGSVGNWSEKFSMDVIQSTGMTSSKVSNDEIYTVKFEGSHCQ
jgi:hypothetical protein